MKELTGTIVENARLADRVFRLRLKTPGLPPLRPGQFVNLKLEGFFLRRPISVFDQEGETLSLIYKVVGRGTAALSNMNERSPGISLLAGLGNGYDPEPAGGQPLLIGGGVGIPPLYFLARKLREKGAECTAVLGFNTENEIFCVDEFRALGCRVVLATADGSAGRKGFVTDVLPENYSYVYACGPEKMLRAVDSRIRTGGQFSLEERMGCGFGACMGCTCQTASGPKRVCREGPVFRREEIVWKEE